MREIDWRLNGQEAYLQNKTLYKVVFPDFWQKAYSEKTDFYNMIFNDAQNYLQNFPDRTDYVEGEKIQLFWHEHCSFCWEKALTNKQCVFYCTKDFKYWVCEQCFNDFKQKFNWTEKEF